MIGEAARDARGRPAWSGRAAAFWRREIEMERVSESESEYVHGGVGWRAWMAESGCVLND